MSKQVTLDTRIKGNEDSWTYVGPAWWKEDEKGVIHPPVWSYLTLIPDNPAECPNMYAHELSREDCAFLTSCPLADVDMSVTLTQPPFAVEDAGVVFRAVDSVRCYAVNVVDMSRKGGAYDVTLWVQDGAGLRRELGRGIAPHSAVPQEILQRGPRSREEWDRATPDWMTLRVEARGSHICVSADGKTLVEAEDDTYESGYVGLTARSTTLFRDLRIEGTEGELPGPWKIHKGELPEFFYPGGKPPEGLNVRPATCYHDGSIYVAWTYAPRYGGKWIANKRVVVTRSDDEGATWTAPRTLFWRDGCNTSVDSLFGHKDGTISCLMSSCKDGDDDEPQILLVTSGDMGETWSEPTEFLAGGKRLQDYGPVYPYSPMQRLSDGTVVMCGYRAEIIPGGENRNDQRRDQSVLLRSEDDGKTWQEPIYFDRENFDHNECMVAEVEPGKLVAFMRTLRAMKMWTSTSQDGGLTWTPLVQSNITGECPFMLRHSSGALILSSRGAGTFLKLSFDQGQSWSKEFRISPASAMVGMTEAKDGRVLIVMCETPWHPGYYIRGQFFRVTRDGPENLPPPRRRRKRRSVSKR